MAPFWWFIPEEWWPWLGLGIVVGWLIGVVRLRTLVSVVTLIVLWPYIEAWLSNLSLWVRYVLAVLVVLSFSRDILAFFLGDRAADHAIGEFVGYLLKVALLTFTVPFRALAWMVRRTLVSLMERVS
jgi:hypothetical protein